MLAVFAVLAAIALASGWRGERFVLFFAGIRAKVLTFAMILLVFSFSAAAWLHLQTRAIDFLIAFVFDILLIAMLALASYALGRIGNALKAS